MSDLGEIFHVKKDGVQYDAHTYTTLDECPEPNLKLTYKGQQAYVKLEAKGEGDVPCYVKTKAGNTYQVKKEAIPQGSITKISTDIRLDFAFTVPTQIHVLHAHISYNANPSTSKDIYVGVTPNKTYSLYIQSAFIITIGHRLSDSSVKIWYQAGGKKPVTLTISWSSEINKQTPEVEDY